jgi:hypothetical protein
MKRFILTPSLDIRHEFSTCGSWGTQSHLAMAAGEEGGV